MAKSTDLCDWEVLQDSDASEEAEMEQQLDFQPDYFSLDSTLNKPPSSDDGSAVSDNPSWIDPASESPFPLPPSRNSADFWSDSGSEKLEGLEKVKLWSESGEAFNLVESKLGFESSVQAEEEEEQEGNVNVVGGVSDSTDELATEEMKPAEEKEVGDKAAWWKIPLDLFKYCAFRVSPVWSLSVAAAFVGFVILGRRLYKMKRKTQGLHLKVIIDDKRVSQFMTHAARLNEAFSLVRRVPIVRPSLPSPGAAPWPVMTMR